MDDETKDFLLMVAAGNTEPEMMARLASHLLDAAGVPMVEIAEGQWTPKAVQP